MHTRWWTTTAALVLICASGAARAQNAFPTPTGPSRGTLASRDTDLIHRAHIDEGGGVMKLPDVNYSTTLGYRPLTLDLFLPPSGGAPHPIVVFLHGGGWMLDSQGDEGVAGEDSMVALARRGYVVVRPGYRLSAEARYPAQLMDTKDAIRWIKTYAATYNADPTRVAIWGSSAGGALAALVGTTCHQPQFDSKPAPRRGGGFGPPALDPNTNGCVQAVVDWYGPVDLLAIGSEHTAGVPPHNYATAPEVAYLGCAVPQCPAGVVAATSAITYIDKSDPPFLIMHGTADKVVPVQQSQLLYKSLQAKGVPAQLILVPNANHIFMGIPQATQQAQFDTTAQWLDQHLRPAG